jgi:hypothetical protein
MAMRLIPTAAVVAVEESTTQMDFGGGDGWAMFRSNVESRCDAVV